MNDEPLPPERTCPAAEARAFPLAFGPAIADETVMDLVRQVHKVRLPRGGWASLPTWPALRRREVARIQAEEGERAFEDLRDSSGDGTQRGRLLERRFAPRGSELVELTPEAERRLRARAGLAGGFRLVDSRADVQRLVRTVRVRKGYLEVALPWLDLVAQPEALKQRARELGRPLAFEDIDDGERALVGKALARARISHAGQAVMEAVLGQLGLQSRNPVRMPAAALRVLLGLEQDRNWKPKVEGVLGALKACSFSLMSRRAELVRSYGPFLGDWRYLARGPGGHGDGAYLLAVAAGFLGCLPVFQSGHVSEAGVHYARFDFGRRLSREDRAALGWPRSTKERTRGAAVVSYYDAGRAFFESAEGLTQPQRALVAFIEREITLRKDPAAPGRRRLRAKRGDPEANEPRIYDRSFCPLLVPDRSFHGALGHFRRGPESGRTLRGSRPGAWDGSLLALMGHEPPPRCGRALERILLQAVEDIRRSVVDYLGGVAAARYAGTRWLSLDEARALPVNDLARRVAWFLFVPATWRSDRARKWEARMAERAGRGEAPCAWRAATRRHDASGASDADMPLGCRLRAARLGRGATTAQVARRLGVSKMTVSRWERGAVPPHAAASVEAWVGGTPC